MAQSTIAAAMTSPATGSILPGASATFSWTPGSGVSAYQLYVGTVWNQASNIYNSGSIQNTSLTVTGLPNNGVFVYVTLFSQINNVWEPTHYTFTASGSPTLAALISPASGSTLPGSSATFSWTPGSGVSSYSLYVGTTWVQADNVFASGGTTATSVTVNNLPADGVIVYATLFSEVDGVWHAVKYSFMASGTAVPAAMIGPAPGSVLPGSPVTFSWSPGAGPTEYFLSLGTTGAGASNLVSSGVVYGTSFTVNGLPTNGAAVYATLSSEINGVWQAVHYTYIEASPALPAAVSCGNAFMTGSGSDSCTVTLSGAAPVGGLAVSVSSSSSAVIVPAAVTVPAGAGSAVFAAAISAVGSAQTAILTASANGASTAFSLQLNAAIPTLSVSSSNLSFGNVAVNISVAQSLTLTSTGSVAVTINSATLSGIGFTMSGTSFPVTLSPNQTATLSIVFDPASAGTAAGTLTISSNSSAGVSTAVSLSGTGVVTLSALSCGTPSFTGSGSDSCTVTLNTAAPGDGVSVTLVSSNSAVTVPASVTLPAGAASASFAVAVTSVGTSQTATLSATEGGASTTFSLQLNASIPTLNLSSASIGFGGVTLNTPETQSLTLTSSGNAAVTVNTATLSGAGFSLSPATFPITLNPGQDISLVLEFDPSTAGAATGQLTIDSNSSTGATTVVNLTGTGNAPSYEVNLSWDEPNSPDDSIAGYNIYRAASGSTMYQLLNSSTDSGTSYVDTSVEAGLTYDYYVETIDDLGVASVPSSTVALAIT